MDFYSLLFYVITLFISYTLTQALLHKLQNLPPFPLPTAPINGHIRYLFRFPSSVHRTLAVRAARYGPVLSLHLGDRLALLVSSPSAAQECLSGPNDTVLANRPRFLRGKVLGHDYSTVLWAPYGPLWRAHRLTVATHILSPHRLDMLSWVRADEVREFIRRVGRLSGEGTVEIRPEVSALTNNVMMRMIAGKRFFREGLETTSDDVAKQFRETVKELREFGGPMTAADFVPLLRWMGLFRRRERKLERVFGKMDRIFQDLVDEKRKEMEQGTGATEENKSLIEVLLELQRSDPTNYSSDTIIKGLVQTFLLGGSDTSASTIEWTLSLLVNDPRVLIKVQQEIDDHLGSCDRVLEETDLNSLPYLHCIIKESLRMHPIAPLLIPHESSADCVVGGYHIRRGTMLIVNAWAIQNDPKIWDDPRVFKPERFLNLEGDHKLGYKFMPFGSGKRACPGENLALRMIALAVGSLIQCFDLKRVGEEMVDMKEKLGVCMSKANPLQLKCSPRKEISKFLRS